MENTESLIANFSPFLEFQGGLFARFQVHNSVCRKLSTAIDVCRNFLEPLWLEHPLIGLNRHRPSSAEPNAEDVVCFARALGLVRRARDRACRVRGRESNAASRRPDRRGGSRPATTTSVAAEARHRRPFRMRRRDPASKYLIEDRIPGPLSLRCAIGPVGGRHSRGSRATAEPAGGELAGHFIPRFDADNRSIGGNLTLAWPYTDAKTPVAFRVMRETFIRAGQSIDGVGHVIRRTSAHTYLAAQIDFDSLSHPALAGFNRASFIQATCTPKPDFPSASR